MDIEKIYKESEAYLEGHFLLSGGMHSQFYLQSAKVLEDPSLAEKLANALAKEIKKSKIKIDTVCAPAIGGIVAGFVLAKALGARSIFTERVDGKMTLRRGFEVKKGENILICEDIITTGGSALESANSLKEYGVNIVGFAALANRGFCKREGSDLPQNKICKLPKDLPFFALGDFTFEVYSPKDCPLCAKGGEAIKPGSRAT